LIYIDIDGFCKRFCWKCNSQVFGFCNEWDNALTGMGSHKLFEREEKTSMYRLGAGPALQALSTPWLISLTLIVYKPFPRHLQVLNSA